MHIGLSVVVRPSDFWVSDLKMFLQGQKLMSTDTTLCGTGGLAPMALFQLWLSSTLVSDPHVPVTKQR